MSHDRGDVRWTHITQAHGGGGLLTDALISGSVLPRLGNDLLDDLLDATCLEVDRGRLAFTIDSYVVQPIQFPGGDIGRLAISGTVNDLAVSGARPLGVALGMILSEGLTRQTLETVLDSIASTAREADVKVLTGDTKVIGKSNTEQLLLVTAGIGVVRPEARGLHWRSVRPGDVLIINGPIADHGVAVMLARELPQVKSAVRSDVAPLGALVHGLLDRVPGVVFMRDPTRGGVAGVCADLAQRTGLHVELDEAGIHTQAQTLHAAEMLGLDPLDVANEGKVIAVVRGGDADAALEALKSHPLGTQSSVIGRITDQPDGLCEIRTSLGGRRIVQKPYGEQLPRIC